MDCATFWATLFQRIWSPCLVHRRPLAVTVFESEKQLQTSKSAIFFFNRLS
jgi:hypothetical protein